MNNYTYYQGELLTLDSSLKRLEKQEKILKLASIFLTSFFVGYVISFFVYS